MNKKLFFRILLVTVLISLFMQKAYEISVLEARDFLEYAEEILGSDAAAHDQFRIAQRQLIVNVSIILLIIPGFYLGVLKPIDKRKAWWFSFPIAVVASLVLGIGLAHLDRWLNEHYYITFSIIINDFSSPKNFSKLQAANIINVFNACLFAGLIFKVEETFFDRWRALKKRLETISSIYWFGLFFICFTLSLLTLYRATFISVEQAVYLVPQVAIVSFSCTIIGFFFLDHFYHQGKLLFQKPASKLFKLLFCSLGILGGFMIIFNWRYEMLVYMDNLYPPALLFSTFIVIVACLITYGLFALNLGGIRSNGRLQANLEHKTSELDFLKSQINPHFLFNSLNTVYGIALTENSPKTASGVQMLSEMMRFMLRENTEELIPVAKEIDYIHNYIELQSLRLTGSETAMNIDLDRACEGEIAPMILIPFIENAFKHGVSIKDSSFIKIELRCRPGEVSLWVKNSKHSRPLPQSEESGIGLKNVKERLNILYAGKYILDFIEEDDTFEAKLKLSLS